MRSPSSRSSGPLLVLFALLIAAFALMGCVADARSEVGSTGGAVSAGGCCGGSSDARASRIEWLGSATASCASAPTLRARLSTTSGVAIAGKTVRFKVGASTVDGTTDALGVARATLAAPLPAGSHAVEVSFAGDSSELGTSATGTLQVTGVSTRLRVGGAPLPVGEAATVSAVLTDESGAPVVGRAIAFAVHAASASGTTSTTGTATATLTTPSCTLTGAKTIAASFAGDACYAASSDSGSALAYVPSGFVIWGGNADKPALGDTINFWGHSWAKQVVSGDYDAAAELKGFAQSVFAKGLCQPLARRAGSPKLGPGCWETKGGASWPPAAPLPEYLGVLVSDSIAKSKGTVHGNVAATAVLRVSPKPAYGNVPGKPGYGTVAAIVDPGALLAKPAALRASQTQPASVLPGEGFGVVVRVENVGASSARAASVSESFVGVTPSSASAALGDLASSVVETRTFAVSAESLAPRGATEAQGDYLARLDALDGKTLRSLGRVRFAEGAVDVVSTSGLAVPRVAVGLTSPECAPSGSTVEYTVHAYNLGAAPASAVEATLTLPDGATRNVEFGALAAGASSAKSVSVVATSAAASARVDITWRDARGSAYGPIGESASPSTSGSGSASKVPVLSTRVDPIGAVLPGQSVPLAFTLSNTGAGTAVDAIVALTGTTASARASFVDAGGSTTLTLATNAPALAPKVATESDGDYAARLAAANGASFVVPFTTRWSDLCSGAYGPIEGTTSGTVALPVLSLALTAPSLADAGDTVTFTASVTNTGGAIAATASGAVTLPGAAMASLSFGAIAPGATAARTVSWKLPLLAPRGAGEAVDVYLARLQAFVAERFDASVALTWTDDAANGYGAIGARASTGPRVPIVVTTAATPSPSLPGQDVALSFELSNTGAAAATDAKIALTGGTSSTGAAIAAGDKTTVAMTTKAPAVAAKGATESDADYLARLASADGAPFAASYQTTWSDARGGAYGPIPSRVGSTVIVPRLEVSLSGPSSAKGGDPLAYTATVKNVGRASAATFDVAVAMPDGTTVRPFASGGLASGATATATFTWTVPASTPAGTIAARAALTWTDSASTGYGAIGASATTSIAKPNACPVVDAGPDLSITLPSNGLLVGTVTDDGQPASAALSASWVQVSGPGVVGFLDGKSASTTAVFPAAGSYVLRLTASDTQCTGSDEITVTVLKESGTSATKPAGTAAPGETLVNVVREGSQLRLDDKTRPFRFIWIAVSTKGTVVKIDTDTGAIVGEYWTSPAAQPRDPSRTTVEHGGGVWASNRGYNTLVHIGLEENGECVDRNGNGKIDTSHAQNDLKAWPALTYTTSEAAVALAEDECVLHFVTSTAYGTRHLSVDRNNDVWVSGTGANRGAFDLVDGVTGKVKRKEAGVGYGGYGGLIDPNGVIWSARPLLRWDPALPLTGANGVNWKGWDHDSYGLCIDPSGNVWNTSLYGGRIRKFAPSGALLGDYFQGFDNAQGCVADKHGDVWIAHVNWGSATVGHLKNNGAHVGNVPVPSGPTGVAVDALGKIWSTNQNTQNASRIDPTKGPLGPDGVTHVGQVDFTTVGLGGYPYNYSDMTGSTLIGAPRDGTWSFVHDSAVAGAEWGKVTWSAMVPGDARLTFRVASSADGVTFGDSVQVRSGEDFAVPNGRYLKVTVQFHRSSKGESPLLYEVSIATADAVVTASANRAPVVNAGPDVTATLPNPIRVTASVHDDGRPSGNAMTLTWSKVSGPGSVTFSSGDREATDVTVSAAGSYVLRLTASDGVLASSDELTLTVLVANAAPTIVASTPLTGTTGSAVSLTSTVTDDGLPTGGALVTTWSKVSGPGAVTFADASASSTTATFAADGAYVVRLTAFDGHLTTARDVAVAIGGGAVVANAAPSVNAGASRTIALPTRTLTLTGTASDDGLPAGSALDLTWSQVSGPGAVTFSSPKTATTTVTTPATAGVYTLRLTASDTALSTSMDVTLRVLAAPAANAAPVVSVGPPLTVDANQTVSLAGVVTDDGLPASFALQTQWVTVSGPAEAMVTDPTRAATTARFPLAGDYQLRLYAYDGELLSSTVLAVRVNAVVVNAAPVVSATGPSTVTIPGFATLSGAVVDDGLPASGTLTTTWSVVSGPGTVTFGSPSSPTTSASFGAAGVYVLRLTADDGALSASFDLSISAAPKNLAPVVSAGVAQTLAYPSKSTTLSGSVTDDGLPAGALASAWSVVSGPAMPTFALPSSPTSAVTFPAAGAYVLRLTASDGALTSSAEVTITVEPPAGAVPVVSIASPLDGARLTKPTAIVGSVSGGEWTLEVAMGDEESAGVAEWRTLGSGSSAVSGGTLATLDTTTMLNGAYTLRLTSRTTAGSATVSASIVVDKQMKVGVFALAFDDLSVAAEGFPLQVQRAYDSRDKRVGDFGVGWNLAGRNVRVEKSVNLGKHWYQWKDDSGFFTQYCVRPTRAGQVTITLPSGKVYRFESTLSPECQTLYPVELADVTFRAMSGTVGSLAAADGTGVHVAQTMGLPGPARLEDLSFNVWNPTRYTLTDEDGIKYVVDQKKGLEQLVDLDGNTLQLSPSGLVHSSGKSVAFVRDAQGRITRITDPSGKALTYTYDAAGDLASFTNREGETQTYAYDAQHNLTSMTDARGIKPASYAYDSAGRLVGVTDAFTASTTFVHDVTGHREIVRDALGSETIFEYDDAGNVTKKTDAYGKSTTYTYDANDNKLSETDPLGNTQRWTYDVFNNVLTETDALGKVTTYAYGNNRRLVKRTDPLGRVTSDGWDYYWNHRQSHTDAAGAVTTYLHDSGMLATLETTTDPRGAITKHWRAKDGSSSWSEDALGRRITSTFDATGNRVSETRKRTKSDGTLETLVTSWTYDTEGRVSKTTYPDGSTTTTVYNKIGKPLEARDQLGRLTTYEYDPLGRQTKIVHPDGTSEQTTYDALGRRATSTDRAGRTTSFAYDLVGRLIRTTHPDGSTTRSSYDAAGRLVTSTNELGHVTTYGYDAAGRRTSVTDALGNTTTMAYNAAGELISVTDPLGHVTSYAYDLPGRQTKTTYHDGTVEETGYDLAGNRTSRKDQAGVVTAYAYDLASRLTSVTDALGGVTTYGYDELGQKVSQTDALSHVTKYAYDAMGRRVSRTLPLGQVETSGYDAVGNLTAKTDFNGKVTTFQYDPNNRLVKRTPDASFATESPVTWTYTRTGRRATMTDATGTTTYGYDARDRLLSKATPFGTLTYTRDLAGHVKSVRSEKSDGVAVDYAWDDNERLSSVTDGFASKVTTYGYDAAGRMTGWVQPNGVATSFTYDDVNHLKDVAIKNVSGTTLASYAYTLGPTGNRTGVTEASGRTIAWTYDVLYRLKSETIAGSASANGAIAYTYDAVGNRLSRTSTVSGVPSTTSTYDANDRTVGDAWNHNGNMLTRDGRSQTFDSLDRLVSSTGSGTTVKVTYDGDGNRVAQEVGGVVTTYLVDDQNPTGYAQVVEERVSSSVAKAWVFGARPLSQRAKSGTTWATSYYGLDGHGSVTLLTDGTGVVTDTWEYDAFGTVVARTGTTENAILYSGEWMDGEQGLQYLRARWYAPGMGRFVSADKVQTPDGAYRYARNNPVTNADPSGRTSLNEQQGVTTIQTTLAVSVTKGVTYTASEIFGGLVGIGMALHAVGDDERPRPFPVRLGLGLAADPERGLIGYRAWSASMGFLTYDQIVPFAPAGVPLRGRLWTKIMKAMEIATEINFNMEGFIQPEKPEITIEEGIGRPEDGYTTAEYIMTRTVYRPKSRYWLGFEPYTGTHPF